MKVVHISYFYGLKNTGGAAIATTRLHRALRAAGIDSILFCFRQCAGHEIAVYEYPTCRTLKRFLISLGIKLLRNIWRIFPPHDRVDLHILPTGIFSKIVRLHPDIVHVHWIVSECISFYELERLPCPVVVHLHDLRMLNGIAPYPHQDTRYLEGFTSHNSTLIERWVFNRKRNLARNKNVVFIGPSQWVKNRADASLIGRGHQNFYVPYFMDSTFRYDSSLRKPHNKFIILFGAFGGRANPIKGFDDLMAAVASLSDEIKANLEIHVFGESASDEIINDVHVRFLGVARSPIELLHFYHSADVFAFPSHEETQGQTKLEALFCGLPVIAFDRTACAEGIIPGKTGHVVSEGDIYGFAEGLALYYRKFVSNELELCREMISNVTKAAYADSVILDRIMDAYNVAITNYSTKSKDPT